MESDLTTKAKQLEILRDKQAEFKARLEEGATCLEEAASEGETDLADWEEDWLRLLHEYQRLTTKLDQLENSENPKIKIEL